MDTKYTMPPQVVQFFSKILLSQPCPKLRDNLQALWEIWLYIESKTVKNAGNLARKERLGLLKSQLMDLYVRTLAKEKNIEEKTKTKAQQPFYYITMPDKRSDSIFCGLRLARYRLPNNVRKNFSLQKE